jgi:FG-GAP-like repeat
VDVNGDGNIDILSGSYSRQDQDMAGLFQVLYGNKDCTFKAAAALGGSDGEPLILPAGRGQDDVIDKICTRPFACDLDGDGKLDIVAGNFRGTFGFFKGEGGGKFAPKATWLEANGGSMAVEAHGDPFLIDWDRDGDLDLLSGSANGGVFLFSNVGSKTAPKFGSRQTLVEPAGHHGGESRFGDAHCVAPAADTRVWAADVDGNGNLDLLVGDTITLYFKAEGVDEATARAKDAEWQKRQAAHMQAYPQDGDEAAQQKWQEGYQKLDKEREAFVREEMTGFVWLLCQK